MCRNIRPLFNFDPPATEEEIHDAALQYVRKLTGIQKPSAQNEKAFLDAVNEVTHVTMHLFGHLDTNATPKNREVEAEKKRMKNAKRFGN